MDSSPKNVNSIIIYTPLFKTCMIFFLLLNTKEDILKNVGKHTAAGSHWLPVYGKKITMEINGYRQLFVFIRRKKLKQVLNNLRIFIFE